MVQRLQHRFHGLHTADQPHQLGSNVAHGAHHRHNPGGGAGGTARAPTLIRHPSSKGVGLLADTCETKTSEALVMDGWKPFNPPAPTVATEAQSVHEAVPFLRPRLAVMGSDGFVVDGVSHDSHEGRTELLPEEEKTGWKDERTHVSNQHKSLQRKQISKMLLVSVRCIKMIILIMETSNTEGNAAVRYECWCLTTQGR